MLSWQQLWVSRTVVTSLAETQSRFRRAVVAGETLEVAPLLVGGRDAEKRLAIHRRHYETSLVTALLTKFPATAWLAGAPFIAQAARRFIQEQPPMRPCIAEYGDGFPQFLSTCPSADRVPYLRAFAELEWHLGHVSVAVDRQPLTADHFSRIAPDALTEAVLTLQPGVRYLHAAWPIDELIVLHVTRAAPERLLFEPADTWLEIRGARGEFHMNRLDASEFAFRETVQQGQSIGEAAECALDANGAFNPGRALAALIADSLVVTITPPVRPEHS